MRSYEKRARKSFRSRTCEIIGLKAPWNEHLQKMWGVPPALVFYPLPFAFYRGLLVMQYSAACNTCKTFPQGGVSARNDAQADQMLSRLLQGLIS